MTLQEIEDGLPNGLHDAHLLSFGLDLASSTLTLEVEVDHSSPEQGTLDPDPCDAKIIVTGLCYFQLQPPNVLHNYVAGASSLIDAGDDPVQKGLVDAEVAKRLPTGSFLHWIYMSGWNSFIVIGGTDAQIELVERTVS